MSMMDKLWDAFSTVIKMNDKVVSTASLVATQQQKIENLTERVIRLETALELGMSSKGIATASTKRLTRQPKE